MKNFKKVLFSSLFIFLFTLLTPKAFADELISTWNNTTALPNEIASHVLISNNGSLFLFGGANTDIVSNNISSLIAQDGTLSIWTTSTTPSPNLFWHSSARSGEYIYLIGGSTYPFITNTNTIFFGKVINNEITSWTATTPLPKNLVMSAAVVVGDKLYVSGGQTSGSNINQDIYYALINSDGSLSVWAYAGQIPEPRYGHGFVEHNGYLYTVGGQNDVHGFFSTVHKQKIQPDGSVSISEQVTELPIGVTRAGVIKVGSKIISVGGVTPIGITNKVYHADIEEDGSLSEWFTSSNSLPVNICCGAIAESNEFIYYAGGHDGTGYFDNVYYTKVDTSAPPPIQTYDLPVALLKQTSTPWQSNEYDSANLWNPQTPTINRWGCALTSATMVLNYHGLTKITNASPLDPGTLNTWLKTQPDGYIGNGLINWLAISRLSKQIKSFNPLFTHDALEYKRIRGMDNEQLDVDLSDSLPGILEVPGHFIVAKGKSATSYIINDPFYNRTTLSDGYNEEYLSLGRYIPSNTDLSYIFIVTNQEITIELDKVNGGNLGEEMLERSITDPVTGTPNGSPMNSLYASQPDSGDYTIKLTTSGVHNYTVDIYVYDKNGNVKKFSFTGSLNDSTEALLPLQFDKNNVTGSSMKKIVSFADFNRDIKAAYQTKQIHSITYLLLTVTLKDIENDYNRGKKAQALKKIDLMKQVITKLSKKDAGDPVKKMLLENLLGLRSYVNG